MKKSHFKVSHDTVHPYVDEAMMQVTEDRAEISPVQAQIAHCSATGFVNTLLSIMMEYEEIDTDTLHEVCRIQNLIVLQTYRNWTFDYDRPETDSESHAPAAARWLTVPLRWLRSLIL